MLKARQRHIRMSKSRPYFFRFGFFDLSGGIDPFSSGRLNILTMRGKAGARPIGDEGFGVGADISGLLNI